jgi:hypothetical protein
MGEYAKFNGERVKIGTCESMYYLRADQAHLVEAEYGNVDPIKDRDEIRFRFPFPDEDDIEPGCFEDFDRGVQIPGWSLPETFAEHGSVQFVAKPPGYVLSIPCPEQFGQPGMSVELPNGLHVGRNGWSGGPKITQQRYFEGGLWSVVDCGACGAAWRLTPELAEEVAVAFRVEADREQWVQSGREPAHTDRYQTFLHAMADRILAGYTASKLVTA